MTGKAESELRSRNLAADKFVFFEDGIGKAVTVQPVIIERDENRTCESWHKDICGNRDRAQAACALRGDRAGEQFPTRYGKV